MRAKALLILATLAFTAPAVHGCASLPGIIARVATVVAKITGIIDLVESQATVASGTGLLPPEVARRITAVRAVVARLNDAAQASPAAYALAVAEFERLYAELTEVVAPLGVRVSPV